jgi:XapX domain-containing protein
MPWNSACVARYCLLRLVAWHLVLQSKVLVRTTSDTPTRLWAVNSGIEKIMKAYFVSLAVGVLVGLIYSILDVKSPAPPTIALVGLLGMLAGEHAITVARYLVAQAFG